MRVAVREHGGPQSLNSSYSPEKGEESCLLCGVPLNLAFLAPLPCHLQLIKYHPQVRGNPRGSSPWSSPLNLMCCLASPLWDIQF